MRDTDAPPPSAGHAWRDAALLVAVGCLLIAGLIHYGSRLNGEDDKRSSAGASASASATTSGDAELDSAPSGGTSDQPPEPPAGTCWDGRQTTKMSQCGLPEGTKGLRWVFPSLVSEGGRCHKAAQPTGYATVVSWVCFDHAAGEPVTVTYDEVVDVKKAARWFEQVYVNGKRRVLEGAHGGRCVWFDGSSTPAKATGLYVQFPYAVSVFAPTKASAKSAWAHLVKARSSREVLGLRAPDQSAG